MRKRKFLYQSIILVAFQILCACSIACSLPTIRAGDVSKVITISDTEVEINISENPEDSDIYLEAEALVIEFVESYSEYVKPEKVVFGDITQEYIYGCQNENVIYIDNTRTKEEILATTVHELLHLQNPNGLDSETEFGTVVGHNLTEALVEKMTTEITKQPDTKRTILLTEWTTDSTYQLMLEAFFKHDSNVFDDFLNDGKLHDVVYQENEYSVTTAEYFKIAFDKWMIVEDSEKHFGKLRGKGEP